MHLLIGRDSRQQKRGGDATLQCLMSSTTECASSAFESPICQSRKCRRYVSNARNAANQSGRLRIGQPKRRKSGPLHDAWRIEKTERSALAFEVGRIPP